MALILSVLCFGKGRVKKMNYLAVKEAFRQDFINPCLMLYCMVRNFVVILYLSKATYS